MTLHPVTLGDIADRLSGLGASEFRLDAVAAVLGERPVDEDDLRPYLRFDANRYTRSLVRRSELFELLVLCWRPGQHTPVHDHAGQLGWVRLLRGVLEETTYRHAGGGPYPDLGSIEIDEQGVGHGVPLECTGRRVVSDQGAVATVDRQRAIHRLGNASLDEDMVTLHVYSRPHDSCLAFDPEARTCRRRVLTYDAVPESAHTP